MNAQILLLCAALSAEPGADPFEPLFLPAPETTAVVRGQAPTYEQDPSLGGVYDPAPVFPAPTFPPGGGLLPFQSPQMLTDPFLGGAATVSPYGAIPGGVSYGANGPQPYRFGWTWRVDVGYLPEESVSGGAGDFGIFEVNTDFRYTAPLPAGWIFSSTPQFNYRNWDTPGALGLPNSVYRVGWDLELATPANNIWSAQLGFNPSVNSDFEGSLGSEAWNFDGRGILFLRSTPQWMWAFGAGFWDRVNDRVIPYAGVVWTPDDVWEWRLIFPNPRVSVFLGNPWGVATWFYVSGEYHIEAYQVELSPTGTREKMEIEDWRLMLGLRSDACWVSSFIEAGWVFERDVEFQRGTPGFNISDGFIARLGLRF